MTTVGKEMSRVADSVVDGIDDSIGPKDYSLSDNVPDFMGLTKWVFILDVMGWCALGVPIAEVHFRMTQCALCCDSEEYWRYKNPGLVQVILKDMMDPGGLVTVQLVQILLSIVEIWLAMCKQMTPVDVMEALEGTNNGDDEIGDLMGEPNSVNLSISKMFRN